MEKRQWKYVCAMTQEEKESCWNVGFQIKWVTISIFFYCKHTKRVLTAHIPTLHTKTTYKTYNTATYANYNTWTTYANYNTWTAYVKYNAF